MAIKRFNMQNTALVIKEHQNHIENESKRKKARKKIANLSRKKNRK